MLGRIVLRLRRAWRLRLSSTACACETILCGDTVRLLPEPRTGARPPTTSTGTPGRRARLHYSRSTGAGLQLAPSRVQPLALLRLRSARPRHLQPLKLQWRRSHCPSRHGRGHLQGKARSPCQPRQPQFPSQQPVASLDRSHHRSRTCHGARDSSSGGQRTRRPSHGQNRARGVRRLSWFSTQVCGLKHQAQQH